MTCLMMIRCNMNSKLPGYGKHHRNPTPGRGFCTGLAGAMLILLVIFLMVPRPVYASAVSMEYNLGFNGHFQLGKWAPLTVVLENRGRAISGQLEVIVTSGSEYQKNVHQTTYTMAVDLPYNSKKNYPFTVLIKSFTHPMMFRLKQGNNTIVSDSLNLRTYYATKSLALVMGKRTSPDFLSAIPKHMFPVTVRPNYLPENWHGYDGVRVIIIATDIFTRLNDKQFEALENWIQKGGCVITSSGINYGGLMDKRTSRILPIKIVGHTQIQELRSLNEFCGHSLVSQKPFLVLKTQIADSETISEEDSIPIIIQRNMGIGKIVFLSLDFFQPPISRWRHRHLFWEKLLSLAPTQETAGVKLSNQRIKDALLAKLPVDFPPFKMVFPFLIGYTWIVGYLFQKLKRNSSNRQKYVKRLAAVILFFAVASYGAFFYPNTLKSPSYNSFSMVRAVGNDKVSSIKHTLGIYTIQSTPYEIRFHETPLPITHLWFTNSSRVVPNTYFFFDENAVQRITGHAKRWSSDFYMVEDKIALPISATVLRDGRDYSITIKNLSDYPVLDCWVYAEGRFYPLGDMPVDSEQTWNVSVQRHGRDNSSLREITRQYETRMTLSKDFAEAVESTYGLRSDTLCLVGWIPAGLVHENVVDALDKRHHISLLQWEIPVVADDEI